MTRLTILDDRGTMILQSGDRDALLPSDPGERAAAFRALTEALALLANVPAPGGRARFPVSRPANDRPALRAITGPTRR